MTNNKQSLQETTQLIVDILSFETSPKVLEQQLTNDAVDWEAIVIVASSHLVLPAVYCRLAQRSFINHLPKDLNAYLEELTKLNRERNCKLMEEVHEISKLFNEQHITHVFIKGTALLAGNYFKDYGERMIGDIDILVASDHLDKAFKLLVSEGYSKFVDFNYEVKNYRHRPRQISNKRLGAIELHDQLLKYGYNHLIDKNALLKTNDVINGIAIPTQEYLIWNSILAQQINDSAYYYNTLSLRGLYDVLVLELLKKEQLVRELSNQKQCLSFLSLASIFCPSIESPVLPAKTSYRQRLFLYSMSYPRIGRLSTKLKSMYSAITDRIHLFIINKSYRAHVLKNKLS